VYRSETNEARAVPGRRRHLIKGFDRPRYPFPPIGKLHNGHESSLSCPLPEMMMNLRGYYMDKRLPLFFSDAWISNQDDFKKQEVREGDENDDCPFAARILPNV
jgi:hypothetical protein